MALYRRKTRKAGIIVSSKSKLLVERLPVFSQGLGVFFLYMHPKEQVINFIWPNFNTIVGLIFFFLDQDCFV